ncbi:hypothetical protein [Clostridium akagii]|uniref:hypothetical protein n=1 Tax=Clostridium akagii TaxID=91623 RepID=UPI00047CB931|nr:hypothetical protein [Clostridium akagii]
MGNKNSLYSKKGPIILFFILLSSPWVVQIRNLFLSGKIGIAIKLSIFAIVFLVALFWMQKWFTKMLIQYQNNLNISMKKIENKKMRRSLK